MGKIPCVKGGEGGLSVSFWGTFHDDDQDYDQDDGDDDHDDQDDGDDDHDDLAQHVATNELLYVVANTCRRLTLLDISYSNQVSLRVTTQRHEISSNIIITFTVSFFNYHHIM